MPPFLLVWALLMPAVGHGERKFTVSDRLDQVGQAARARLAPCFQAAGVAYPPRTVVLLGLKDEGRLEVYGANGAGKPRFIRSYGLTAKSGKLGPKLRQGDGQIPEGIYRIEELNPNSRFHLSLRLNYPNDFDQRMGQADGRADLGGDIMIHGGKYSIGCLAVGDEASEELFVLAADTGLDNMTVLVSPVDFRGRRWSGKGLPPWSKGLYSPIKREMGNLPPRDEGRGLREDEERLYRAIAEDMAQGKPLVVTTFVNLTYYGKMPALKGNMYWGGAYGYDSFFAQTYRHGAVTKLFGRLSFKRVLSRSQDKDPREVAIFTSTGTTGGRLRGKGTKGGKLTVHYVNIAFSDGNLASLSMARAILQSKGAFTFRLEDGTLIDAVKDARLVGFAGHNPFFDGSTPDGDDLGGVMARVKATSQRTVGVFAIGCHTGNPLPQWQGVNVLRRIWRERGVAVAILFSRSFMSAEAYSLVAMVEGIVGGMPFEGVVRKANGAYQAIQRAHGRQKVGRPFVAPLAIQAQGPASACE